MNTSTESGDSINAIALWESVGGDFEYFEEMIVMFVAARRALMENILEGIQAHELYAAARVARILRNSLRSLQAAAASDLAATLEAQLRANASQAAERSFHLLETAVERAEQHFSQILAAIQSQAEHVAPQNVPSFLV